jgi:hypothetical protein
LTGAATEASALRDLCLRLTAFVGVSGRPWHGVTVTSADGRVLARRDSPSQACRIGS